MSRSNYDVGDLLTVRGKDNASWVGRVLQVRRCAVLHRIEYLIKSPSGENVWVNHYSVDEHRLEEEINES